MASFSSIPIYQPNSNQVFVSNSNPCLMASSGRRRKTISYPNHTQIVTNPKQHMSIHLPPYKVQALDDGNQAVGSQVYGEEDGPVLPLKVGILGFGKFGQFIARGIQRQGHIVLATSRSDYSHYCFENGMQFFRSVEEMCEQQPDVILICSSILSTEDVVRAIPTNKLSPNMIFADVLSVKQFPRNLLMEVLPQEFGIVCTHPMFGPESGKHGWGKLPFVYDKVRINNKDQACKCNQFLQIFESEGCRLVEMSCEEHDRHAAGSQFITHTIGRILSHLDLESTPINTKGYETLLQLTENTVSDSFDLYYGLFMYNVNATEQIENLDRAFETVKQKLFGRLHDILRKQIVERVPMNSTDKEKDLVARRTKPNIPYFLPNSESMNDLSSFSAPPAPTPTASRSHEKRGINHPQLNIELEESKKDYE